MMTLDIDFGSLTVRDTLDLALKIEQEAEERYIDFAEQMEAHHTDEAARFFRTMATNERKHADTISAKRRELFPDEPVTADTTEVLEVEAPGYEKARAFMSAQEALRVALESETRAHDFYQRALEAGSDDRVVELLAWLRDEEVRHQQMVRGLMERAPGEAPVDPDDFVDEPTAQ